MYEDRAHDRPSDRPGDRPYFAEVNNTVSTDVDDLYVTIPGIDDGHHEWGPCFWSPRPGETVPVLPIKGNKAVVQFDDDHNLWVLQWWPY